MSEQTRSVSQFLPYLVVLSLLLLLEHSIFVTYVTALLTAGDSGPLIGIQIIMTLISFVMIILGFDSICRDTQRYRRLVFFSLVLFLVQMFYEFLTYVLFALDLV